MLLSRNNFPLHQNATTHNLSFYPHPPPPPPPALCLPFHIPMSLRHGHQIEPRPTTRLSGWFERHGPFFSQRRWLELDGSVLNYRRRENGPVEWSCDLREGRINAGRAPMEIVVTRPANAGVVSLFALSAEEMKLWFVEMKRVADSLYDFYHISAKIGHTAAGTIHLGRDRYNEMSVAILAEEKEKLPLHKMLLLTKRDLSIVSATQSHPNLVRVEDLFESTQNFYIVTELISGGTLSSKLQGGKMLKEDVAKAIVREVLLALGHLHTLDIVHGAVDKQHVVCVRRELPCGVKLITYGNAVSRRDARLLGEAGRMSAPEVVCFERRTPASDVFSAGILLYEMLTGREPFKGEHEAEYLSCVSKGIDVEGLGEALGGVLKGMLADDASARPGALDCLQCAWFSKGVAEIDPGHGVFERLESDPKTVITEFKGITPVVPSAISKLGFFGANGGAPEEYGGEL